MEKDPGMDWLIGFAAGFLADLFRSVFAPASTEWVSQFIPSARRKVNVTENVLTLDIMEKLKGLGKDPNLVRHSRDDAAQFMHVLTSQQDAFVEHAIEVIDSTYMTQVEMNMEAARRADVARLQMERAIVALERSGWMDAAQAAALDVAQARWKEYALAQAEFSAAEFEGGSMKSLIFSSEMETITLSRIGDLKRMLDELRLRSGDDISEENSI